MKRRISMAWMSVIVASLAVSAGGLQQKTVQASLRATADRTAAPAFSDLKSPAEGWARVTPFAASHGLTYPILLDDGSVEQAFKVTALPATYLVDRAGRIAATYIGVVDAANLEANIKVVLAER